jgi:hypothetical protein
MRVPREEFTMKKLVLSLAAVAAFACGGAGAQGAVCQAGAAWGTPAGCGHPGDAPGYGYGNVYRNDGVNVYNNSGWPPANSNAYPYGYALPGVLGALGFPQIAQQYPVYPQNQARRNDRDGDGVRNSRDRYPDDARYR